MRKHGGRSAVIGRAFCGARALYNPGELFETGAMTAVVATAMLFVLALGLVLSH
ncbi:hypothetical protein [Bradyrhizobium yuanmingense]|uniref:hypothetical protein n=1 Tax=Bradyrhizobium yuanmingense TaxID=108015 RepID=UPI0012E35459|nr:hypothetical protein [Bradyrhizobium yuanmingense]